MPVTSNSARKLDTRAPHARRMLIVGLDGATFDVLTPLMEAGKMPRLKAAIESGVAGTLHSTVPPITPAAWTTFLTGKNPGSHGVIDFERFDVATNKLSFNSTRTLAGVRNIWDILGNHQFRVGSINVPLTYPPTPVRGFMVSGFETPGPESDFAYPPELKPRILQRWPDPTMRVKWRRSMLGGDKLFAENIAYMARSFHQGAEMTRWLGNEYGWDVLMVVLKLVDNLQHKTWKHIDPRWRDRQPRRRDLIIECFHELDRAVGDLLDYAGQHDATVLMISDHGHGSLEGKVQPNWLLKQWGYLKLRGTGARMSTRIKRVFDRLTGRAKRFARTGDVLHDLAVDFDRTRACIMHAGMAGFLYVNLKGRQPTGIVDQADYEPLRNELIERFLDAESTSVDSAGNRLQLFSAAHKPEEIYDVSRDEQPWLPDLMLIPRESLAAVRKIRGRSAINWLPQSRIEGTHRPNGVLIACGPGVAQGRTVEANIVDCAPTVLTLLGLPVPQDMQGLVITDLFAQEPQVEREDAVHSQRPADTEDVYTERELQEVTDRLSDLGYLE